MLNQIGRLTQIMRARELDGPRKRSVFIEKMEYKLEKLLNNLFN